MVFPPKFFTFCFHLAMNNPYFPNNRPTARRHYNHNCANNNSKSQIRPSARNFTDNFVDFPVSDNGKKYSIVRLKKNLLFFSFQPNFQNPTIRRTNSVFGSNTGKNFNASTELNSTMCSSVTSEKSFSSLFEQSSSKMNQNNQSNGNSSGSASNNSSSCIHADETLPINGYAESSSSDDDGIYLQISNLDQWYDETNLKHYLMNQLKPITPILSLTIETPSIAKVKVPSVQVS